MTIKKHSNGTYYAHLFGQNPVNLHTQNKTEAQALAKESRLEQIEFAARAQAITAETVQRIMSGGRVTMDKAFSEWRDWVTVIGLTPNTVSRYAGVIQSFIAEHAGKQLVELEAKHVDDFVNPESQIVVGTRRNRLAALQSFFKACVRRSLLLRDPSLDVTVKFSGLTFEQKEPRKRDVFTNMELALLERVEDPFWSVAIVLGWEYGLRMSDVAQLEWASFDVEPGRFVIWTDKHDKRISFDISANLRTVMPKRTAGRFVFPQQAALAADPSKRAALSVGFRRELDRLGIQKGKTFHCLRHTFAVQHRDMGESVDSIRQKLGHSLNTTTEIYLDHPVK